MTPRWLNYLERWLSWIAVPNIAIILVTLQGLGFLMVSSDVIWLERLALVPSLVLQGELWRLITFMALPLSLNPIWVLLTLWFLYFILNAIESHWGSFKTTFYILVSYLLTLSYAFLFNLPVTDITDIESSLFLAAATLFPKFEVLLFMIMPVKMKWLGLLTGVMVLLRFLRLDLVEKGYLLAIYSNYLIFFGPSFLGRMKQLFRSWNYRRKL